MTWLQFPQLLLLTPLGLSPTHILRVIKQAILWLHNEYRDSPSAFILASYL